MNDGITPPSKVTFGTAEGQQLTIHPADYIRRLPGLELAAEAAGVPVAAVWAVMHFTESQGRRLHAGAGRVDGQPHVWIVVNRAPCPILRLALLRHELTHIERGDLDQPSVYDDAEADADAAAEAAIQGWASVVTHSQPVLVNPSACVKCFHRAEYPCRQGEAVFEAVRARLHRY